MSVGLETTDRLENGASRKQSSALKGHQRRIAFVTLSHDQATAGMDAAVKLWDTHSGARAAPGTEMGNPRPSSQQ